MSYYIRLPSLSINRTGWYKVKTLSIVETADSLLSGEERNLLLLCISLIWEVGYRPYWLCQCSPNLDFNKLFHFLSLFYLNYSIHSNPHSKGVVFSKFGITSNFMLVWYCIRKFLKKDFHMRIFFQILGFNWLVHSVTWDDWQALLWFELTSLIFASPCFVNITIGQN